VTRDINPRPGLLPTILDLARLSNAVGMAGDIDPAKAYAEKARGTLLCHREVALRNLLLTFRAKTLSDAVAQLYCAFIAAEDLDGIEQPNEDRIRNAVYIRRALLSAIPVVAEAAGLNLAEIGAEYIPDIAAAEFPAEA
jgi:hypothetical protein